MTYTRQVHCTRKAFVRNDYKAVKWDVDEMSQMAGVEFWPHEEWLNGEVVAWTLDVWGPQASVDRFCEVFLEPIAASPDWRTIGKVSYAYKQELRRHYQAEAATRPGSRKWWPQAA